MLVMDVNDNAISLIERGVSTFFSRASARLQKLTAAQCCKKVKKPNFRHKKPRSFDQGLCYRLEVGTDGFLRSSKAFSGP